MLQRIKLYRENITILGRGILGARKRLKGSERKKRIKRHRPKIAFDK